MLVALLYKFYTAILPINILGCLFYTYLSKVSIKIVKALAFLF